MEQARYWMWPKPTQSFYGDSWEEQAFAVDAAAGSLGGCVWPPRSYTCSFCRREFRSAQALGGHMNVHRRDRARLKQSQYPLDHEQVLDQNHRVDHSTPLDFQYSHQVCNPNSNSNSSRFLVHERSSFPLFSSSIVENLQDNSSKISIPVRSDLEAQTNFLHDLLNQNSDGKKVILSGLENSGEKDDSVKADLSTSLNLSIRRKRSCEDERSENINCKRFKFESTSLVSFSKTNSSDRFEVQSEVLELSSSSIEDLDLELNLGIGHKKCK